MPTSASTTFSAPGGVTPIYEPEDGENHPVKLADATYAAGTVIGEVTATPGTFGAYATGNSDGTEVPKAILQYGVTVASGVATGMWGETYRTFPAWFSGTFRTTELTGLDTGGVTAWQLAHLESGTVADGVLRIG